MMTAELVRVIRAVDGRRGSGESILALDIADAILSGGGGEPGTRAREILGAATSDILKGGSADRLNDRAATFDHLFRKVLRRAMIESAIGQGAHPITTSHFMLGFLLETKWQEDDGRRGDLINDLRDALRCDPACGEIPVPKSPNTVPRLDAKIREAVDCGDMETAAELREQKYRFLHLGIPPQDNSDRG